MAITQDRFIRIIEAAEMYQRAFTTIERAAFASSTTLADIQAELSALSATLRPSLIAAIELERRYFARFAKYNEREKMRQRRRRLGLPGGTGGHVGAAAKRPAESAATLYATLEQEATMPHISPEEMAEIERHYQENRAARTSTSDPTVIKREVEWGANDIKPDDALQRLNNGESLF